MPFNPSWIKKLREHGDQRCKLCGHSGYAHGEYGCIAYREGTPTRMAGKFRVVVLPEGAKFSDYYCGCKNPELCKTREEIVNGESNEPGTDPHA